MATARITCPDCKSVLRPAKPVPDGKKVRCPKCGNLFITPGLTEEEEERPRTKKSYKKAPNKKAKAALKKDGAPKPPPKKSDFDDDEGSGGIYSFVGANEKKEEGEEESRPQIEYAPDMSIKDLRGPAQEMVVKPSNLIMLIGGLSALSNLFLICWSFWPIIFSDSVVDYYKALKNHYQNRQDMSDQERKSAMQRVEGYKEFKDVKDKDLEFVQEANEKAIYRWVDVFPYLGRLWLMSIFIFVLIYNAIAIVGAVKVQNLESRRWGIASSIMMLLPLGGGGLSCLFALAAHFLEDMTGFLGEKTMVFYMIVFAAAPYVASLYIGVMSLHTLMDQKVIDGFEYVAE
jgi:predicted Zn finger-like uncharacterized protein